MTHDVLEGRQRRYARRLQALAFFGALCLSFVGLVANNVTLANLDYTGLVVAAAVCAGIANVVIAGLWRRMSVTDWAIAGPLFLANLWTLSDACGRRLPSLFGWW